MNFLPSHQIELHRDDAPMDEKQKHVDLKISSIGCVYAFWVDVSCFGIQRSSSTSRSELKTGLVDDVWVPSSNTLSPGIKSCFRFPAQILPVNEIDRSSDRRCCRRLANRIVNPAHFLHDPAGGQDWFPEGALVSRPNARLNSVVRH